MYRAGHKILLTHT